jgi:hypothetical protein
MNFTLFGYPKTGKTTLFNKDLEKAKNPEGEREPHLLRRLQLHLEGGSPLRGARRLEGRDDIVQDGDIIDFRFAP